MPFLSANFAAFLVLSLLAFYWAPTRWRSLVLLTCSLAFYARSSPWHAGLVLLLAGVGYVAARSIEAAGNGRRSLAQTWVAVSLFLLVLTCYKCIPSILGLAPPARNIPLLDPSLWIAPLGLSYYIFKLIGYVLDVYWAKLPAQRSFVSFALYVAFFPQLVSGPIQRAEDFDRQLPRLADPDPLELVTGLRRILLGVFKKVVIADQLAVLVDQLFLNPAHFSALELLVGVYGFAFQLYADFSGLTDIAIGVGQLFGIKGPENFDRPYSSRNVQEFWRRWHMSLTSWLTDYLFLPLRMTLRSWGQAGLGIAIFLNMVAIGLWHGPTVSNLVFGVINGIWLVVSAFTLKPRNRFFLRHPKMALWRDTAAVLITFHLIALTFVIFRAGRMDLSLTYFGHLFGVLESPGVSPWRMHWQGFALSGRYLAVALLGLAAVEAAHWPGSPINWLDRIRSAPRVVRWTLYYGMVTIIALTARETRDFIYGQF